MSRRATVGTSGSEPVNTVASAMETAVQAARDGAADAKAAVDRALPAISQFVSRCVYTTTYSLSYGFVFPTMFLVRVIPKDNALVHGMIDGAQAARDMVDDWQSHRTASPAAEPAALRA
jgi:hypothetical protein